MYYNSIIFGYFKYIKSFAGTKTPTADSAVYSMRGYIRYDKLIACISHMETNLLYVNVFIYKPGANK